MSNPTLSHATESVLTLETTDAASLSFISYTTGCFFFNFNTSSQDDNLSEAQKFLTPAFKRKDITSNFFQSQQKPSISSL